MVMSTESDEEIARKLGEERFKDIEKVHKDLIDAEVRRRREQKERAKNSTESENPPPSQDK